MRRNSVSVEEGVVVRPENAETKKPPERLFLRSASVGPGDGEQSPSPIPVGLAAKSIDNPRVFLKPVDEKRQNRRESIRDHLMKFKAKAGKILEEVQSNKAQDEPSVSFVSDGDGKDEISIVDEQAISENSSQQGTSRRESKDQLRNRIRKSAQKAVERTRGNVQLNRRLARRPTVVVEEQLDENDQHAIDEQVDKMIKMGEKFLKNSTTIISHENLIDNLLQPEHEEKSRKAEMVKLVYFGRTDPQQYQHDLQVKNTPKDKNIICGEIINREALRKYFMDPTRRIYKDSDSVFYAGAEQSNEIMNRMRRKEYCQLDIFIDSIHFDHHNLWCDEEVGVAKLRNEYFLQILRVHQLVQLESHQIEIDANRKSELYDEVKAGRERVEVLAQELESIRKRAARVTTNVVYHPAEHSWEEDWMKFGKIEENGRTTAFAKLPKEERERVALIQKTSIQLILYFNDIEVSKTSWISMGCFLMPVMRRFELELYSPIQSLVLLIVEKQGNRFRELGRAKIPVPSERDMEIALHEAEFECSQDIARIGSSLGSNERNRECGRILCRAILENGQLKMSADNGSSVKEHEAENRKFELIPADLMIGTVEEDDERKKELEELKEEDRVKRRYAYKCELDSRRTTSLQFANISRQRVMERRRGARKKYEEIVREISIPTISVAFSQILAPADKTRRLKPMRREDRAREECWENAIVVNIQSATNLPTREYGQLQPFVVVSYERSSVSTDVALGRHPSWQFTGRIEVASEERREEFIEIRVYDQLICELEKDNRVQNVVHEQLSSRLLASAKVRFETLTNVGKINSPLKLQLPVYLSNYKINESETCFLKILLSTHISPRHKLEVRPSATSFENQRILEKCRDLEQSLRDQFPTRVFRPLVVDMNAKSTLGCRFLRAINPPTIVMQENPSNIPKIIRLASQIISCIPRVNPSLNSDIWATANHLSNIAVCGLEERSVLLACWLLYFKLPVAVILGESHGEKTGFVLTEMESRQVLIDSIDASVYLIADPNCPLEKISGALDCRNYYANVQEYDQSSNMEFNLTRTSHWKPLFHNCEETLDTIQPSIIQYSKISEDWIVELKVALDREIRLRFDEARAMSIPQWNLIAARQLREILESPITSSNLDSIVREKLSRVRESYKIECGVLRMPYTSIQDCVHEVLRIKLHESSDESAQFALAVHIVDFFAHVVSVEIAIALLKPRK